MTRTRRTLGCGIALAVVMSSGCGGVSGGPADVAKAEAEIKTGFQTQMNAELAKNGGAKATVDSVDCVKKNDSEGRCFAVISGDIEGRQPINITFGEDGEYLWEADQSDGPVFEASAPTGPEPLPEDVPDPSADSGNGSDPASRAKVEVALSDVMKQQFPDTTLKEVIVSEGIGDTAAIIKVGDDTPKATAEGICEAGATSLMDLGLTTESLGVIYGGANSDKIIDC